MTLDGYMPFHHGRWGLYSITRRLAERTYKKGQTEEERGRIDYHGEIESVTLSSMIELDRKHQKLETTYELSNRLANILEKTARIFKKRYRDVFHLESLMVLYRALSKYPHELLDLEIKPGTKVDGVREAVCEKTFWVVNELRNAKKLRKSRANDLFEFVHELHREARQGGTHIPKNLKAA